MEGVQPNNLPAFRRTVAAGLSAIVGRKSQLWLRNLDRLQPAFAGTEKEIDPFWSPMARFLGFLPVENSRGSIRPAPCSDFAMSCFPGGS